jgi:transcriptional regulator with XRE-family HTH domain
MLGMSQQELAARAGSRREKVNRLESRGEDIGLDELSRLLDALGLELSVAAKVNAGNEASPPVAPLLQINPSSAKSARRPAPRKFKNASFIDGSKAKILNWGKVPR